MEFYIYMMEVLMKTFDIILLMITYQKWFN